MVSGEYPPVPGGVADYTGHLAQALASRGQDVRVLTSQSSSFPKACPASAGIRVERLLRGWGWPSVLQACRWAADVQPDIVSLQYVPHLYGRGGLASGVAALPLLLQRLAGLRTVTTFHEVAVPWGARPRPFAQGVVQRLQAAVLALTSARLITTNPMNTARLSRFPFTQGKIAEIPVGATVLPRPARGEGVLTLRANLGLGNAPVVGQFSPIGVGRDPGDLLRLLLQLPPDAHLLLIGGRPDSHGHAALSRLEQELGLQDRVHWTGPLSPDDVSRHLGIIDVYVHTQGVGASTRSTALATALAHGLPVVAFRGSETSDLFTHGETLVLCPAGDLTCLAVAVRQVLGCPALALRLRQGARLFHSRYQSWETIASQFLEALA